MIKNPDFKITYLFILPIKSKFFIIKIVKFGVKAFRIIIWVIVSDKLFYNVESLKSAKILAATTKTPEFKNCWIISLNVKTSRYSVYVPILSHFVE